MPKTNKNKLGQTFHPLTEQAAREWYKLKFLNTPGYLLAIKSFFTKPDSDFVIPNVAKFCREWGISKSAFYRAINTLTSMGKLSWEATEGIVLKPHNKVTIFPRAEHCPTSGTVSHERDGDSHERDGDSHERDGDSHERDTPIYKDRARNRSNTDLNTDLIQISPLTPQGEQCEKTIEVEVEILEEETHTEIQVTSLVTPENFDKDQSISKRSDVPGACDNKAKSRLLRDLERNAERVQELQDLFESGKVTRFPKDELRLLAGSLIGEQVQAYRQSGDINCASPNDIDPSFVAYVEGQLSIKARNSANAASRIRNCEQDATRWRELIELVKGWQQSATSTQSNDFDPEFMALVMAAGKENY